MSGTITNVPTTNIVINLYGKEGLLGVVGVNYNKIILLVYKPVTIWTYGERYVWRDYYGVKS